MIKLKKILFPTDFSRCADYAFQHALRLALQYNAELHIFHAMVLFTEDMDKVKREFPEIEEDIEKYLQKYYKNAENLSKDIKVVKTTARGFSISEEIIRYAADIDADIIVCGTHGRGFLGHFFLGSVAEKIIRFAPCPALTIKQNKKEIKPYTRYSNLLIPFDFSQCSKKALTYGVEFSKTYNASLTAIHIVEQPIHPAFYAGGVKSVFELNPNIEKKAKENFDNIITKIDKDIKYNFILKEGEIHKGITDFALNNKTDLLIMGTHGLSGIEHFLIGSTTEKVIRRTDIPVLTVKSQEKDFV